MTFRKGFHIQLHLGRLNNTKGPGKRRGPFYKIIRL